MPRLGELLQEARLRRGLSLDEAERATHIAKRYLQALEADDLSPFPAPVFARGFLRNYSQYLGLDPETTQSLLSTDGNHEQAQSEQPPPNGDDAPRLPSIRAAAGDRLPHEPGSPQSARAEAEPTLSERLRGRSPIDRGNPASSGRSRAAGPPSPARAPARRATPPASPPTSPALVLSIVAGVVLVLGVIAFAVAHFAGNSAKGPVAAPAAQTGAGTRSATSPPVRKAGTMPAVVGSDSRTAIQMLRQAGVEPLVLGVASGNAKDAPGAVLRQDPAPGSALSTDSNVTLVVNGTAPTTTAPIVQRSVATTTPSPRPR